MFELVLAALTFVGTHFILSHRPIRDRLIARLGVWPHRAIYSAVAIATLLWLIGAYGEAPSQPIFDPGIPFRHVALTLMLFAFVLVVGGYTIANPSAMVLEDMNSGGELAGILKITRAPVMWGVGLFALSHMLANPDPASWVFFGALAVLAIGGGWHLDRRKLAEGEDTWLQMAEQTSFVPLAALISGRVKLRIGELGWWRLALALALYAGMLAGHEIVFGVTAFPLP